MKRNKSNPDRQRKRRRRASGQVTWRESLQMMGGKGKLGLGTQKRDKVVSPVEQDRRRRLKARSEVPPEIREIVDEMGVVLPGEEA